ncbi:unnamed protein product [Bemisia tabaci]|uniref:CP-type G domain-containing protein n=1 Tax=Bemisia tabaci TaxID=7038 RepID=A0A9P0FAN4_BEMTA|nr:unnamed protein product [Bemisia tabaci]
MVSMRNIAKKGKKKKKTATTRYAMLKRVAKKKKKEKKLAKKAPKRPRPKIIQIPNCPLKEGFLKDVDAYNESRKEEKKKAFEEMVKVRESKRLDTMQVDAPGPSLEKMMKDVERRQKIHSIFDKPEENSDFKDEKTKYSQRNTHRSLYREFKKVIEAADVILHVLDARDPLGTRSVLVEKSVDASPGKRLVYILNKADLVPRESLEKWLVFLRKSRPTVAFKASTQQQQSKLGQRKLVKNDKMELSLNVSSCVGAELLMTLLANYCRNKDIKTSIVVGVVGLPNVGKSSLINSLKRQQVCQVGKKPGITRTLQVIQLDKNIKLLDSPGVVFARNEDKGIVALKGAFDIPNLTSSDVFPAATAILQRASKQQMKELYDIPDYKTPGEFFLRLAQRLKKVRVCGIPDLEGAARTLMHDWHRGKIRYFTVPPEKDPSEIHLSAKIVNEVAAEFNVDSYHGMESADLNKIIELNDKEMKSQPDRKVAEVCVDSIPLKTIEDPDSDEEAENEDEDEEMEEDGEDSQDKPQDDLSENIAIDTVGPLKKGKQRWRKKKDKGKDEEDVVAMEPGIMKIRKVQKMKAKKVRKEKARRDRAAMDVADNLEKLQVKMKGNDDDNYNFELDFFKHTDEQVHNLIT